MTAKAKTRPAMDADIFDAICDRLANGESLRAICSKTNVPSIWSFLRYVDREPDAAQHYARAREANGDYHGSSVAQLAADVVAGIVPPDVARVAMDAHKWTAGRLKPKVYGDKLEVESRVFNVTITDDDKDL
jgi:hypothetical protein